MTNQEISTKLSTILDLIYRDNRTSASLIAELVGVVQAQQEQIVQLRLDLEVTRGYHDHANLVSP